MMNGDHGWGMGWGFPFFGPVFWLLIVIGTVYFVRWLVSGKDDGVQESPLDILKRRYARGEIDRDTLCMRIEAPDDNELGILRAYLEKNGQRAVDMSKLVGADTPGGLAFQKTCAQCHALPDPAQHTRNEWPAVIERMRTNVTAMGKQLPDQATTEGILSFLQAHAVK